MTSSFRKLNANDGDWIYELLSNPAITQFLPFGPLTRQQSDERLQSYLKLGANSGFTGWYVLEKDGKKIAYGFIRPFLWEPEYEELEIGYLVAPAHWKKGVASELTRYLMSKIPEDLPVLAFIHDSNIPSQKIAKKSGFDRHARSKKYSDYWIWSYRYKT